MENFLIIIYILGGFSFLFFISTLFLLFRKEKKENTLTLLITETFRKTIESLIVEEVRRNLLLLRGEMGDEQKKITHEYKKTFEELGKELERQKDEIKNQTLIFSKELKEKMKEIEKVSQEIQNKIFTEAKEKSNQFSKTLENTFFQTQNQLLRMAERRAEILGKNLEMKFSHALYQFQEELKKELRESKIEIENYKKEQMAELDKKFYSLISEISKEFLGKVIDLSTHERLVMEVLEKAKRKISL